MRSITGYVLDTGIVVELLKYTTLGRHVDDHFGLSHALHRNVISVVTVGESLVPAERLSWGDEKKATLWTTLRELEWIDINDQLILEAYAKIDVFSRTHAIVAGQRGGITMGKNDLWIAASAHVTGMPLITTDSD